MNVSRVRAPARAMTLALALLVALPIGGALAQDNQINTLVQQIQRLRDDLTLLQRDYYQGRQTTPPPAATLNANPQVGTQFVNQFETRLAGFEDELRSLVGTIERIDRGITDSRARLDKLVGDVDFRLNAIERQLSTQTTAVAPPAAATVPPPAAPTVAAATPRPATAPPTQPAAQQPQTPVEVAPGRPNPAAGAQVLGVLTPEQARTPLPTPAAPQPPAQAAAAQAATILPRGTPKEQYDFAYGLLQQFRIPEAERAFTEFLAQHAANDLSHNARYWLGETYYSRAQYQQAAVAFFDGYQKAPSGPKAADNLLKLGMSLGRMDQKQEACATLAELTTRFPNATQDIRNQATSERRRLACA